MCLSWELEYTVASCHFNQVCELSLIRFSGALIWEPDGLTSSLNSLCRTYLFIRW